MALGRCTQAMIDPHRDARWCCARAWNCALLVGLLLVTSFVQASALAPSPPLRDYAVDVWTSRDGLPHNSIRDIAQTADGYLWFATWEGLVRYNGLEFTIFDRSTRPALPDNGIGALYVDPHGALWSSDSRGDVSRYGPDGQFRTWRPPKNVPNVIIQTMSMDRQGRLWLVFEGNGLGYLLPDGRYVYEPPPVGSALRTLYTRMAIDTKEQVWVGSYAGLVMRDASGKIHDVSKELGLQPGFAWPYLAPDGTLWLAAQDRIYRMHQGRAVLAYRIPGTGRLTALLQDRHGDLWIGTENSGVLRAGHHGIETLASTQSTPRGRIVSFKEDAEGSIWVGTNAGLLRLRETLFTNLTKHDGLSSDYVRVVLQDAPNAMWIGTSAGLNHMGANRHVIQIKLPTDTKEPPSVLSLARETSSVLWVGTYVDGIYRVARDGSIRRFGLRQGLPQGNVRAISVAPDGTVWLATQQGLAHVEGGRIVRPQIPGLPSGLITAVYAEDGAVWMGTLAGVYVLRGRAIEHIDLDALGGGHTVFGFVRIGDAMWISSDRGLYRYRNGGLARVGLEQGMPVDTVFQLLADRDRHLWITSNRGVLRTDLQSLEQVADGTKARIAVVHYNEMDGMANAQGNGSSGPPAMLHNDGTVWVATAGGLATVDPKRLPMFRERPPPPVVIESVEEDAVPLPWHGLPVLSLEGGHRLTVSYVGLSYLLPERTQYRTFLQGLDTNWVQRGGQRSVEFVRLPPGDYTLHVSAAHPDGPWSSREAVLRFHIRPFLWQRHSVWVVALLVLGLLLFALYRYRVHRYRINAERLTRLVDERTRDLQVQAQQLRQADLEKTDLLYQLRLQSEAFERQAREDVLTGLPNRRALDERLTQEIARAQRSGHPLCLAMLDVDHFKKVNDQHSHGVGDSVLKQVGSLLVEYGRNTDMAARSGGEEFCLVFIESSLDQAAQACARLHELFHAQTGWGGVAGLQITFSAGLVQLEPGDRFPAALYQRADRLLYRAKRLGRDRTESD